METTRRQFVAGAALASIVAGGAALGLANGSALAADKAGSDAQDGAAASSGADAGSASDLGPAPDASKTLKVICTNESYKALFEKYTAERGPKVEFISMSSGEALSKLKAEGGTPAADLWFGGGIDSFMDAKANNLLEQVNFAAADDFAEGFKDEDNYWFSKGVTVVGFITNNDILNSIGVEAPQSWDDLIKPEYAGEVLMSNPAISGTNYAVVAALLQTKGEEAGWEYFEALNENIPYFSKRGADPATKTAAGEVGVGITYIDGTLDELMEGSDMSIVYPSDGMPYMPDGVAVFKGAENVEAAKDFIVWLMSSDENWQYLAEIDQKNTCLLVKPNIAGLELDFDATQLLDEDLSKFGTEREAILERWQKMTDGKNEE